MEEVANLRINVFSEYPYLYQGTMESEKLYLKHYLSQSNIILVLIKLDNQTIGAVLGSPLEGMGEKYVTPFLNKGLCVNTIYYLGDIILKKEYRGKGLGGQLYAQFEAVLNDLGGYKNLTICEIATSEDDPLRPNTYFSLDNFWKKRGYEKRPDICLASSWKKIGDSKETDHKLVFSIKQI